MLLKARAEGDSRRCAVVATVVSSSAVGNMAEIEGFEFHQTATGFKNIGLKGHELKQLVRLCPLPPSPSITSKSRSPRIVVDASFALFCDVFYNFSVLLCSQPRVPE